MKKGYHTWPSDGKPHPVGKKHKKKKGYPVYQAKNSNYKVAKWEFIK